MDESGKNIVKVINEKVEITGAAALTFTGYPPTVVLQAGLKEDRPPESSPEIILGADLVDAVRKTDDIRNRPFLFDCDSLID